MSCGEPHEVECAEALLRVYEYLDGEMQSEDTARIRRHIDECGPCLREFGIEDEVKALIQRCHPCDPAPGGLRSRVMAALESGQPLRSAPLAVPGSPSGSTSTGAPFGAHTPPFGQTGPNLGPTSLS